MEKLPEKWYIKTGNQEELNKVIKWVQSRGHLLNHSPKWREPDYKIGQRGINNYYYDYVSCHGTEISFEDFKRLVLKENIIPEYVECIRGTSSGGTLVEGKIYLVEKQTDNQYKLKDNNVPRDIDRFKPSTKEAFEAQNKPKEPELIVGNWYEGIGGSKNRWLFKYKSGPTKDGSITNFKSCTPIDGYIANGGNNIYKDIKPANMEEVYDFFPEERPNQNIVLIIGKVYVINFAEKPEYDSIFTAKENYYHDDRLYINRPTFQKSCGGRWSIDDYKVMFREATPDEIKWLDACIKADKFIPKEEALKTSEFKVGDWVTRINDNHLGMHIGDIDQITKIEGRNIWLKKFRNSDDTGNHSKSNLRLSTPEEIAKVTGKKEEPFYIRYDPEITKELFDKLSSKLTITLGPQFNHVSVGTTYEDFVREGFVRKAIKYDAGNTVGWCIDNNTQHIKQEKTIWDFVPKEEFMDNFEKPKVMSYKDKFKVGDKVKCIGESNKSKNGGTSAGWEKDLEFTITNITYDKTDYHIAWGGKGNNGVYFDSLELVPVKQELTSLPEKWCIQWKTEEIFESLKKHFNSPWIFVNGAWSSYDGDYHSPNYKPKDCTEITFEQFKKWVMKEDKPEFEVGKWYTHPKWENKCYIKFHSIRDYNSVNETERISQGFFKKEINWSISYEHTLVPVDLSEIQQYLPEGHIDKIKTEKIMDMEEIQEECKRRFPIGCSYVSVNGSSYVLKEDNVTYKIVYDKIYAHDGGGCLYNNGKYAELVSMPKSLIGRWVKVICSGYGCHPDVIGQYFQIEDDTILYAGGKGYKIKSSNRLAGPLCGIESFELMPEGFTPPKAMKFKIGDSVKILDVNKYITDYTGGIPRHLIIHGQATLHSKDPNAKIVDIYKEYYIVNFINENSNEMQLGYLEKDLQLITNNKSEPILDKEELLYEAKRRYPITCQFKSFITNEIKTVIGHDFYFSNDDLVFRSNSIKESQDSGWTVYKNGRWAEIISKPEEYILGIDPFIKSVWGEEIQEKLEKQLIKVQKGWIDPSVQTVNSINVSLKQKQKVTYF